MDIHDVPQAYSPRNDYAPMPLPPAKFPKLTALTPPSTGTLSSKVLETDLVGKPVTKLVELICKTSAVYGYYWRWHTETDTANCTTANANGFVDIGHIRHFAVPSGATKIQFLGDEGTSLGVLVEY